MLSLPWLLFTAATAATWTVPTDYSTIGAAVSAAASGDVIRIEPGTWIEWVRVSRDLTFEGEPGTVWVSQLGDYEALEVDGATVTVRGIQFGSRGRSRAIDVVNGGSAIVDGCVFADGVSADGGGIRARYGGSLTVRNSTFLNNRAEDDGGGIFSEGMGSLVVTDSAFLDGTANDGAALAVRDIPSADLERLWFEANEAIADGGGLLGVDSDIRLVQSMLCDNRAGDDGAGIDLETADLIAVGNAFVMGRSVNAGAGIDADGGSTLTSANNAFVGHQASEAGGTIDVDSSSHTSVNDLIAFNGTGVDAHEASGASLAYVAFWDNDDDDTNAVLPATALAADPQLIGWPFSACGTPIRLDGTSPLIDAGDPSLVDVDGSTSDIGPLGGPTPLAAVRPTWDLDGDGVEGSLDCNDRDPTSSPNAVEICDGRDNDCDGATPADEVDADGDGYLQCGDDCDDGDAAVLPGAAEVAGDEIDQDCDGDELCYEDADGDGFGTGDVVDSDDVDCTDAGEAANADDVCPTGNDRDDRDADGTPDGCDSCPDDLAGDSDGDGTCDSDDPCPLDVADDSDGDGVCDTDDVCPGGDDSADGDGDGIPDDCDDPPGDTGTPPEPTDTGTAAVDGDSDGDGIPDAIDPDPTSAGGDGEAPAPQPAYGCGCAHGAPLGASWALLLLTLVRRRS